MKTLFRFFLVVAIVGSVSAASQFTEILLSATGGPGTWGQSILVNGGGGGILVQNNSVSDAAYGILSATTSKGSASITARSTGYYAGFFQNTADSGSNQANANNIGVVGHSRQSNAAYFEQGAWNETLARSSNYPTLYVTRNAKLGGHDYTGALVHVDDTTPSSGNLLTLTKQGKDMLKVKNDGKLVMPVSFTPASASAPCEAGTIASDDNYFYRCVAANTWKRVALSTW